MQHWRTVRRGLAEAVSGWLYDRNVRFIDYGFHEHDGELQFEAEPRIRVHVVQKFPEGPALEAATAAGVTDGEIPKQFAGVPVGCPQGSYRPHQSWGVGGGRRERVQPLRGGISISDAYRPVAGTLGGPVRDRVTGQPMILSNWHVLSGYAGQPGWPIYQPGRADGGGPADEVARLVRHAMGSNLDAAVAVLSGERPAVNYPLDLSPVRGYALAQLGMYVKKSGRTTGVTQGVVTGVEGTQRMYYAGVGYRMIKRVFTVTPGDRELSLGGDSGSFWIDESTMHAVGLHFGGNAAGMPEQALAIDIGPILDALGVDLLV